MLVQTNMLSCEILADILLLTRLSHSTNLKGAWKQSSFGCYFSYETFSAGLLPKRVKWILKWIGRVVLGGLSTKSGLDPQLALGFP